MEKDKEKYKEQERHTADPLFESGVTNDPGEMGPTGGVGLPEALSPEDLDREDTSQRESLLRTPSDMRSVGSRDAGDDGIPGGLAEGGAESLGGSGGVERDNAEDYDQRLDEGDLAGMGGTGALNEKPDPFAAPPLNDDSLGDDRDPLAGPLELQDSARPMPGERVTSKRRGEELQKEVRGNS